MKKEELKELGLTDEQADAILAMRGKEATQSKTVMAEKEAALEAANRTISELQETVKCFDGVDIDGLKNELSSLQKKYDTDLSNVKLNSAIDIALTSAKAYDVKAVKPFIDMACIKLDGDKMLGLDDQLKKLKTEKAFLFEAEKPVATVSTGKEHQSPLGSELDAFTAAAMQGAKINHERN